MRDTCHILVVEDNDDLRAMLEAVLDAEGYRFTTAQDAASGRKAMADSRPNLLIANVLLPGGEDGISLAKHAADQGCPALLVTGNHTLQDALEATPFAYMLKPFRVPALVKAIQHILRTHDAECAMPDAADD